MKSNAIKLFVFLKYFKLMVLYVFLLIFRHLKPHTQNNQFVSFLNDCIFLTKVCKKIAFFHIFFIFFSYIFIYFDQFWSYIHIIFKEFDCGRPVISSYFSRQCNCTNFIATFHGPVIFIPYFNKLNKMQLKTLFPDRSLLRVLRNSLFVSALCSSVSSQFSCSSLSKILICVYQS